jgi:hypothetical protein
MQYMVFPLHCHNSRCEYCARLKGIRVAGAIEKVFAEQKTYMMTITWHHDKPPQEVWAKVGPDWNRIRTAIVKRYGAFKFVRILETHTVSPYPHLHVILSANVEKEWLSKECESAGAGFICNVEECTSLYAGYYVRKYLTKAWPREDSWLYCKLAGCRIWSASRGLIPPECKEAGWTLIATKQTYDDACTETQELIRWDLPRHTELVFTPLGDCALVITAHPPDIGPDILLDQTDAIILVAEPEPDAEPMWMTFDPTA